LIFCYRRLLALSKWCLNFYAAPMNDGQQTIMYPADYLCSFTTEVFMYLGVPKTDAEQASDVLARSDLRGIDSHGIARLRGYFEMLELGRINPASYRALPATD
jgi:LDH2 family malate/lactate/ureidoglycolate dehydrogenase